MGLGMAVRELWGRVTGLDAAGNPGERKTAVAPLSVFPYLGPSVGPGGTRMAVVPKPTAATLRRLRNSLSRGGRSM
jgi:hypothetical protein